VIRIGFIGTGGMGMGQARAFAKVRGCQVCACADPSPKSRRTFVEAFPDASVYDGHRILLADPDVDAAVVSVPTGVHCSISIDALKARKPTLEEKPMARTTAQCRRMMEAARRHRTLLMVAHCRRFDPGFMSMVKAVRAGKVGRPAVYRHVMAGMGPGNWFLDDRLGGGPLLDGAVHKYDLANLMFGDPERVISSGLNFDPTVTAMDTGTAVVRYAEDNQLLVSWSWRGRGLGLDDVIGPRGFLQPGTGSLNPPAGEKGKYGYHCLTDLAGRERLIRHRLGSENMYVEQARHFVSCIQRKSRCRSPGEDAIKAVAVGEAVLKAARGMQARNVTW